MQNQVKFGLTYRELSLVGIIWTYENYKNQGACFASQEILSENLGVHRRDLRKVLASLKAKEYLTCRTKSSNKSGSMGYYYILDNLWQKCQQGIENEGKQEVAPIPPIVRIIDKPVTQLTEEQIMFRKKIVEDYSANLAAEAAAAEAEREAARERVFIKMQTLSLEQKAKASVVQNDNEREFYELFKQPAKTLDN